MRKLKLSCAAAIALVAASGAAPAQLIYQGPGTYLTYGNPSYGPKNSQTQSTYGHQTYARGSKGSGRVYSTYGNRTYGPNGSVSVTQGRMTYESNGAVSQSLGNQTYIRQPNGSIRVCSSFPNQTYCH